MLTYNWKPHPLCMHIHTCRSEGFPRTGLFHPWARWGRGPVAGKNPCRRRATGSGCGGWGCAHVILSPDKETNTRQGSKHPTRKQALNEEKNAQRGNKRSTKKQALNEETRAQRGNKRSTRKQALNEETSTPRGNVHAGVMCFPAAHRFCTPQRMFGPGPR